MDITTGFSKLARVSLTLAAIALAVAAPSRAQTPEKLNVAITANDGYTAFFAQDLGLFQKAGLNVDVKIFANGPAIAAAVASRDLQIGLSNVVTIAQARERGLPFTLVAPVSLVVAGDPSTQMVALPDSPVRTGKDLNNKTIGAASIAGILRLCAQAWIDRNGGDSSTVKFVEVTPGETLAALQRGTIAAALMVDPALAAVRPQIRALGNPMEAIGPRLLVTGFFANDAWIAQNPQVAKTFARVIEEAGRWANDAKNRPAANAILAKYTHNAASDLGNVVYARTFDSTLLQPILDSAVKYKFLSKPLAAADIMLR
jgi:NitT/TauT family transport system substrate-binding protein